MKRRPFLKIAGGIAGAYTIGTQSSMAEVLGFKNREANTCEIPLRELGRTGEKLPTVVFPGLALAHYEQELGTKEIHRFCKAGLNFFDVAPAYGKDGECEKKMGIALQGLERSQYFLSCKTQKRDKEGARKELERSLERLKTDYFDLYQLHYIRFPEEVKQALAPGGAMETILKAKEEGKIRYIGFSSHTTKGAIEALRQFKFDTVMFPINYVDYYSFGFGKEILEEAEKQGTGVLAMKALCGGKVPKDKPNPRGWWYRTIEEPEEVDLAIRFALSQKSVVAVIPPSYLDLYEKSLTAAKTFHPITEAELERLKGMAFKWESVFMEQQKQVSMAHPHHDLAFPDSPYECGRYV